MIDNKILANAAMNDKELDNVAGGYLCELQDLYTEIYKSTHNNVSPGGDEVLMSMLPALSEWTKSDVKSYLKEKYNIEANIDIGWLGLGWSSEANTYKDLKTGKSLAHWEVIKIYYF